MHTDMLSTSASRFLSAAQAPIVRDTAGLPMQTVVQCPDCGGSAVLVTVIVDESLLPAIPLRVEAMPTHCPEMNHPFTPAQTAILEDRMQHHIARVGEWMLRTYAETAPLTPREREKADFATQYRVAQAKLDADTRERDEAGVREIAALIPEGMTFDSKDMLWRFASLMTRKKKGGEPLLNSERYQLLRSVDLFWLRGSAVAV
jgi:hypothetical protein